MQVIRPLMDLGLTGNAEAAAAGTIGTAVTAIGGVRIGMRRRQ